MSLAEFRDDLTFYGIRTAFMDLVRYESSGSGYWDYVELLDTDPAEVARRLRAGP